jgi:hypothetical protein
MRLFQSPRRVPGRVRWATTPLRRSHPTRCALLGTDVASAARARVSSRFSIQLSSAKRGFRTSASGRRHASAGYGLRGPANVAYFASGVSSRYTRGRSSEPVGNPAACAEPGPRTNTRRWPGAAAGGRRRGRGSLAGKDRSSGPPAQSQGMYAYGRPIAESGSARLR